MDHFLLFIIVILFILFGVWMLWLTLMHLSIKQGIAETKDILNNTVDKVKKDIDRFGH